MLEVVWRQTRDEKHILNQRAGFDRQWLSVSGADLHVNRKSTCGATLPRNRSARPQSADVRLGIVAHLKRCRGANPEHSLRVMVRETTVSIF
jgi:hypothetical protein